MRIRWYCPFSVYEKQKRKKLDWLCRLAITFLLMTDLLIGMPKDSALLRYQASLGKKTKFTKEAS